MLSNKHLTNLVEGLGQYVPIGSLDEFTFESNPATFTPQKVNLWKELGISRVSLGIQSFDPHILSILGREHTPEEAKESVRMLQEAGIPQVNIDLMFSIPGQSLESWQETLRQALLLAPDHISAYNLTYEEDTAFFESLQLGEWKQDEERDAQFFTLTHDTLTHAGMRHYETSNFAKDDKISLHNLGYWLGDDYIGIGPGAVSTIQGVRYQNTSDTTEYIESTLRDGYPASTQEIINDEDFRLERIALLLRTDVGLPLHYLPGSDRPALQQIIDEQLGNIRQDKLFLSDKGRLLVDSIAQYLC